MSSIDEQFQSKLNAKLNMRSKIVLFYALTLITISVPLAIRIVEVVIVEEDLTFLTVTSFLLVPLLRIWQLLPLFYFEILNSTIRFWFNRLNRSIEKDSSLKQKSLSYYYKQFVSITGVSMQLGFWLNPFLFFSLSFSLVLLCLTIYFLTQTDRALEDAIFPANISAVDEELIYNIYAAQFNLIYTTLQILIAITFILTICISGRRNNEEVKISFSL